MHPLWRGVLDLLYPPRCEACGRMREHLIRTQEKAGHKAGSWNPQGTDHGARGGRIYATCMALMTLQTYYRHLPMYRPVKYAAQ